ncbi:phosphoenolpyruvate synthase [Caenispirillum salinarum]|uniref:phosphoenolpyruvate synthase n=1 Tax=Caenispirillum salinarum TaxID=859058 RepID=UPI00384E9629
MTDDALTIPLDQLGRDDGDRVGGKNASLGEMIGALHAHGIRVPGGFATTANAYRTFIAENTLRDGITEALAGLKNDGSNLAAIGKKVRGMIEKAELPAALATQVREGYSRLKSETGEDLPRVAVRSSATAEDLPSASFAGQLESFLNVQGEDALLKAVKDCFASLFTDRAISYRERHGFDHMQVAVSVGVQRMVRSDIAGSGVMFSLDTESGFPGVVLINAAHGLGETVVQGQVEPDEYHVFKKLLDEEGVKPIVWRKKGRKGVKMVFDKPTKTVDTKPEEQRRWVLTEDEVMQLARWAVEIENHYDTPMDMEWAKDGESGELYIVQARPETVHSRRSAEPLRTYAMKETDAKVLATGTAIGAAIAAGKVKRLKSPDERDKLEEGDVLVTGMTDPDWVPIMKKASAIVTDRGGRTSHAAIVSRELGLTAIVGADDATERLKDGQEVTVSCAEGDQGKVYEGIREFEATEVDPETIPKTRTQVMVNLANPTSAYTWWKLPADGVGLARMEFIINNMIGIHPMALCHFDQVEDKEAKQKITELTADYDDRTEYFVDRLSLGVARIAAAFYPNPVILRMSDFKTNEYADLIGGAQFEQDEANPMLGWRGASRYYDDRYREGFALECRAVTRAREEMGLTNIKVMIPFCRTPDEADRVLEELAAHNLIRGRKGLEVYVMAEIPSNVILADQFASRVDGFSIGSNDLTQLVLGLDRDNDRLGHLFRAEDPAVARFIGQLIHAGRDAGVKVGICGQAPSDHPEFAQFLVEQGITSISVTPDSFLDVKCNIAEMEARNGGG